MMIRVELVLLDLLRVEVANGTLRHLLADTGVDLAHLRTLTNLEALVLEVIRSLNGTATSRGPNRQRTKGNGIATLLDKGSALLLAVLQKRLGHSSSVRHALLGERRISLVRVLLGGNASSNKVGSARLDVKVGQVEDNAVRQVAEGDIVVEELLSRVDHLDVVELLLIHGIEDGNLHVDAAQVQLGSLIRVHARELHTLAPRHYRIWASTHVRGGDLDIACILTQDGLIVDE